MTVVLRTALGRPVAWAQIALTTDVGDSHAHNDDRCLVLSSRRLGSPPQNPLDDFVLCVLADGATGSTFSPLQEPRRPAGWRASQLAEGAFVEAFLSLDEVDVLERLKGAIKAADARLATSTEGVLSSTLTALFVARDGTAYGVSVGDSVLLSFAPRRDRPGDRRLKKLGYEENTALGTGETLLPSSESGGERTIEQWWPGIEGDGTRTRLAPGTCVVLLSDGVSGSLPADVIGRLAGGRQFDVVAETIVQHTRQRRLDARWLEGGSTSETGLDNMTVVALRFDGQRRTREPANLPATDGRLVSLVGHHGGATPDAGGSYGLACLTDGDATTVLPGFLRGALETEPTQCSADVLARCFALAEGDRRHARLAVVAMGTDGTTAAFGAAGASAEPV